jgi:hypothetical protein
MNAMFAVMAGGVVLCCINGTFQSCCTVTKKQKQMWENRPEVNTVTEGVWQIEVGRQRGYTDVLCDRHSPFFMHA